MLRKGINLATDTGDLTKANKYYVRLEEICELKPDDFVLKMYHKFSRAIILKSSLHARDRVKAED